MTIGDRHVRFNCVCCALACTMCLYLVHFAPQDLRGQCVAPWAVNPQHHGLDRWVAFDCAHLGHQLGCGMRLECDVSAVRRVYLMVYSVAFITFIATSMCQCTLLGQVQGLTRWHAHQDAFSSCKQCTSPWCQQTIPTSRVCMRGNPPPRVPAIMPLARTTAMVLRVASPRPGAKQGCRA